MPNDIVHFAIHADDGERAKAFYQGAFGWRFEPWGPPGFWLIETSPGAIRGALQQRQEPLRPGQGMQGFECTIGVEDVAIARAAVIEHGGEIALEPTRIEGVGTMIQFHDTEGNKVGAMQYDPDILEGER